MHRHYPIRVCLTGFLALSLLGGCGDDSGHAPATDAAVAEADASPAAIDGSVDGGNVLAGIVAVNSDYNSTSVSLLDRDGNLVMDGCFNSGSGGVSLATTLSGDVVLPTQIPPGGPIVLIDRSPLNDSLTWLDPATCAPLRQLAVGTGFHSNPHDVVLLSASKAYVTRAEDNAKATPTTDDFDEGSDLLVIDPAQPRILGRIDLKPFAPAGVLPRADRALYAGGMVYVSLNAISADYMSYGGGRIVIVDPATDQVIGAVDLPELKNCGAMVHQTDANRLLVACNGAYGDPAGQAASSAIAIIDLGLVPPAVVAQVAAATGSPFSNLAVAALDANTAVAVVAGDFSGTPPDSVWSLPLSGAQSVKIWDSSEGFAIGAVLAGQNRVLVADGTTTNPAYLRVFDVAAGIFTLVNSVKTNPTHKLPPRALAFY
jgi:hypothetical protein